LTAAALKPAMMTLAVDDGPYLSTSLSPWKYLTFAVTFVGGSPCRRFGGWPMVANAYNEGLLVEVRWLTFESDPRFKRLGWSKRVAHR